MKRRYITLILFLTVSLLSERADACPMCQGENTKRTATAYKGITLLLALLPVVGGGAIFYWMYSRSKQLNDNND